MYVCMYMYKNKKLKLLSTVQNMQNFNTEVDIWYNSEEYKVTTAVNRKLAFL